MQYEHDGLEPIPASTSAFMVGLPIDEACGLLALRTSRSFYPSGHPHAKERNRTVHLYVERSLEYRIRKYLRVR